MRNEYDFSRAIMNIYEVGYTTGVFDLFHVGHLNLICRAKERCKYLIVGVSTDELVREYKGHFPVIPFEDRVKIVEAIKYVDKVVPQISLNKLDALEKYKFNVLFHGNDWKGSCLYSDIEMELLERGVETIFLPYTDKVSSTNIKKKLEEGYGYSDIKNNHE